MMFYKAIGFVVWKAAKFYVGQKLPARKVAVAGAVALGVATMVAVGARHDNGG
jgi:hypothetical protein